MKNDFEVRGEVAAIFMNSPTHGGMETLISSNKIEIVKSLPNTWYVIKDKWTQTFYVYGNTYDSNGKAKKVKLHRWITKAPVGYLVDHIDHETLNNVDSNLRIVTQSENQQNRRGAPKSSKSGILGVSWNASRKKWVAKLKLNGKTTQIGYFEDIEEAERRIKEARSNLMPYSQDALSS